MSPEKKISPLLRFNPSDTKNEDEQSEKEKSAILTEAIKQLSERITDHGLKFKDEGLDMERIQDRRIAAEQLELLLQTIEEPEVVDPNKTTTFSEETLYHTIVALFKRHGIEFRLKNEQTLTPEEEALKKKEKELALAHEDVFGGEEDALKKKEKELALAHEDVFGGEEDVLEKKEKELVWFNRIGLRFLDKMIEKQLFGA